MSAPARRRPGAYATQHGVSARRACALFQVARSTLGYASRLAAKDAPVVKDMRTLAAQYPRYGYRRIHVFLRRQGHGLGVDRVHRLWRTAGLQVPRKRPRRRVAARRPRPTPPVGANHVWAYDFLFDACANGQSLKCLTIVDEWTRECFAIDVAGSIRSRRVIEVLTRLVSVHGAPRYLRSDNGLPQKSRRQRFPDLTPWSADTDARRQAVPPLRNHTLTIVTQGQAHERPALTWLNRASYSRWKVRALSTRSHAPRRPVAKGSSRLVSSLPGSGDTRCRW